MFKFSNLLLEKTGDVYEYGVVMLNVKFPMEKIHKLIKPEDVYEEEGYRTYGLEDEPHITLLYGLHREVTIDPVKKIIDKFTFEKMLINNISLFENDDYDVLKFDIQSSLLHKINDELTELPHTNDYPDYQPHMTIGYLKKGEGAKYVKLLKGFEIAIKSVNVLLCSANGNEKLIKIKQSKKN